LVRIIRAIQKARIRAFCIARKYGILQYMKTQSLFKNASQFLDYLNEKYNKLHTTYENLFWISYMGDHSVDKKLNSALAARDEFRSNPEFLKQTKLFLEDSSIKDVKRLKAWKLFFEQYQIPESVLSLKKQIDDLESKIMEKRTTRKEGYIDPKTKKFVAASENAMRMISRTHSDEKYRKAAFEAMQKLPLDTINEYIELVNLRNIFATELGFENFYAYKLWNEEGMNMKDLFNLFDTIYEKTKYAFADIRILEKTMPGLRHPWNYGYMLSGDFTKEEDQYYQFDQALDRWGRSFSAIGIDYQKGELQLDLLDRAGKYNNGFCHYPKVVYKKGNKLVKGVSNFTCNVVYGQPGSGMQGMHTLFHEGGHAADRLNSTESEICINTEYPPASTAWAETQSMFLDTMFASLEWKMRYAKNEKGESYPFELFERKVRKLGILSPLSMNGIHSVMEFEKRVYESKNITTEKIMSIAKQTSKKFFDYKDDTISLLNIPHIYSWESACSYHGYGLAELGLEQWRQYFYDKYGYIVDNPQVGKEMSKVWKLGSSKTFPEFIKLATGKKLSSKSFINTTTRPVNKRIALAKKRIARMEAVKQYIKPVNLNASIKMVHGKKVIADNKKSFEDMARKYGAWLKTQIKKQA